MHGCGAASSKGSFQATCHGTIYRQTSQRGRRGCGERVICWWWSLAPGTQPHDLTRRARAAPRRSPIWAVGTKRTEKTHSSEGEIEMELRKEKNSDVGLEEMSGG